MKTAGHRKNGAFGYKAVVTYPDGRTHIPVRHNFKSPDEARAYALKWIAANDAPRGPAKFAVRHMGGSSDTEGEMHFAIIGPTIDHSFAHGDAIARLIENTLNAAYAAFVEERV